MYTCIYTYVRIHINTNTCQHEMLSICSCKQTFLARVGSLSVSVRKFSMKIVS